MIEQLADNFESQQHAVKTLTDSPLQENLLLCLRLILQAHLHQLDAGITDVKLQALCEELDMASIPDSCEAKLAALQVLAAQLLPRFK